MCCDFILLDFDFFVFDAEILYRWFVSWVVGTSDPSFSSIAIRILLRTGGIDIDMHITLSRSLYIYDRL